MHPIRSLFFLAVVCLNAYAEQPVVARRVMVLPTTDTSGYGLGEPLQNAYGQLLQGYGIFRARLSGYSLQGFTKIDIARAFQVAQTETIGFIYLEKQRISVFLFDSKRPGKFIATYRMISDPPEGKLSSEFIESRFREAVYELVKNYSAGNFQTLPGSDSEDQRLASSDYEKAESARRLFREMASIQEKEYYVGAAIGMARFTLLTDAASTINFGGYGGMRINDRASAELGVDVFSYALMHVDGRYLLPIAEKYVSLSASLGAGRILGAVTNNRGYSTGNIENGTMVFGPGMSFDIPLLGATIRGEMRFYLRKYEDSDGNLWSRLLVVKMRYSIFLFVLFSQPLLASESSLHKKIADAALRSSLDPKLVEAVIQVESNFKPHATSDKGAMGLMQVMPHTADACEIHDPYHAVNNVMGACECLRRLINHFQGNVKLALAAYNAGPMNVERYHGIPPFPETVQYVKKVLRTYQELKTKKN